MENNSIKHHKPNYFIDGYTIKRLPYRMNTNKIGKRLPQLGYFRAMNDYIQ